MFFFFFFFFHFFTSLTQQQGEYVWLVVKGINSILLSSFAPFLKEFLFFVFCASVSRNPVTYKTRLLSLVCAEQRVHCSALCAHSHDDVWPGLYSSDRLEV